ncbi:MAG TPA: hypothetical protein VNU92_11620 [Edaphobacter sp.]|jgi:hypothetical protein|nr:hypothetical protein [Edaphobacter sp.]
MHTLQEIGTFVGLRGAAISLRSVGNLVSQLSGIERTSMQAMILALQRLARGRIGNPNFTGSRVRGVFFFAGNWKFGPPQQAVFHPFYGATFIPENASLFTLHPRDPAHLGWSESKIKRIFALDSIQQSGANTVIMSYWGEPSSDRWRFWAPMQTATGAHDELFDEAVGRPLLIMPAIESAAAAGNSNSYFFSQDFPGTPESPAPALVAQVNDLVNRYLINPKDPKYADHWLQLFDRNGVARYAINLLHVASAQLASNADSVFAAGFDRVADLVFEQTGVRVGFTLDVLVDGDTYVAIPESAGSWLEKTDAVLAIQGFIPEIASDGHEFGFKLDYWRTWLATGIPVFFDVSPGYNTKVFKRDPYGDNLEWRDGLSSAWSDSFTGIVFNAWNGYTEGFAAMPTVEHEDTDWNWIQQLFDQVRNTPA